MSTCLKSPMSLMKLSIDRSSRKLWFRAAILVIGFTLVTLTAGLTPQMSHAGTVTVTGAAGATSKVPTIGPPGVLITVFITNNKGPFNVSLHPFTVGTTGTYSATVTTPNMENVSYFLTGFFTRGSPTPTPLGNFFASIYSGGSPYTETYDNLSLVAGQQYTLLVAYAENTLTPVGTSTITMTGPGCIAIGSNTCTPVPGPALSEWGMILLASLLAILGVIFVHRCNAAI
ncbi:MAG: hypothetical protein CSYNP_03344 [Syntrophus sp. SKADARSKE-3]|nr:hypothetical protein [Syntrophus sp. SKADARSKE-3]